MKHLVISSYPTVLHQEGNSEISNLNCWHLVGGIIPACIDEALFLQWKPADTSGSDRCPLCVQSSAYVHPIRAQSNYKWLQVKWKRRRAVAHAAANGFTVEARLMPPPAQYRWWFGCIFIIMSSIQGRVSAKQCRGSISLLWVMRGRTGEHVSMSCWGRLDSF